MREWQTASFLGRGLSFVPHLDKSRGGFAVSVGQFEPVSVAASFILEKWTTRQDDEETSNHVAEAIYHILFTKYQEHETIPDFFSKIQESLFQPNSHEFRLLFSTYLKFSVEKWEKRAKYPMNGVNWYDTGVATDRGELPVVASVEFITQQHPRNMVAPFVTVRQARTEYYPASVIDNNGHDLISRYYKQVAYMNSELTNSYIRLRKSVQLPEASDDIFYKVKPTDTWMLIAHNELYDVRYWFYPYLCFIQDRAKQGATRDILNPNIEPPIGDTIRLPSRERILLINSRR
jgi:phage baseplate assembly protein W